MPSSAAPTTLTPVGVGSLPPERFAAVLPAEDFSVFQRRIGEAGQLMYGRVLWNVNSTAQGGGVAEMLRPLLAYSRGAGIDARWLVLNAEPEFFDVTKRLHNRLHGSAGDGGELDATARDIYERIGGQAGIDLRLRLRPTDIVVLHDPQTAGMVPAVLAAGVPVIWRCHVGVDRPNELARSAIEFLLPYVHQASMAIFSRDAYIWPGVDQSAARIIMPSIDAFSPKNEELAPEAVSAILAAAGLIDGVGPGAAPVFTAVDGSPSRVDSRASLFEDRPVKAEEPIVLQVSRWDRLKDHLGVMKAFAAQPPDDPSVQLVLAGPDPTGVADDPEAAEVLAELQAARDELPRGVRSRIHLALLPMNDVEENAAIVNALQCHATIVVQKSLAEGFGLTVAEALWKARPVVASRVGGIQDQVIDGTTGLLVDPTDLDGFAAAVNRLLADPEQAAAMGLEGQRLVRKEFLGPRHLLQYLDVLESLEARPTT